MPPWLLRTFAVVAPEATARRLAALTAVRMWTAYDAARPGRRNPRAAMTARSANQAIGPSLAVLRERSRDLIRNTPTGRVVDILQAHVVGPGVTVSWDTGRDATDRALRQAWADWSATADITGRLDFGGVTALAFRAMLESGESVVRMRDRRASDRRRVKMALQVLEADLIDTARDDALMTGGERSRLGVALGPDDEFEGLWLHDHHPGEPGRLVGARLSVRHNADDLCHMFEVQRPGQVRGVPRLARVAMSAQDLADLLDALVVKSRMEACLGLFVKQGDAGAATLGGALKKSEDGQSGPNAAPIEDMRPGMVFYGRPGEEVQPILPSSTTQYEAAIRMAHRSIAAGAGITYDQLTGDLTQANYSSLRAGKIEFRRAVEQLQWHVLVPMFVDRVVSRWLDRAILAGVVRPRADGYARRYVMPAVEPVDPVKELQADILAVRAGRMSPQDFVEGWGRDWRDVQAEHAAFFAAAEGHGLVFDIDPRRQTQAGLAQPRDTAVATE